MAFGPTERHPNSTSPDHLGVSGHLGVSVHRVIPRRPTRTGSGRSGWYEKESLLWLIEWHW